MSCVWRRNLVLLILLGWWAVLLPAATRAQEADQPRELVGIACPFLLPAGEIEGETMECFYLIVPQDRQEPEGVEIELALAVLYSPSDSPLPDPLLYLEGGPGGSALSGVEDWVDSPLRIERDIILLDQRGTGYSYPRLHCYEADEIENDVPQALAECAARLAQEEGVDLRDYNTINSAADVAALRVALGYNEWNLYGVSYGTRLALTVMRDQPQGIRSVILDSSYPPVVDGYDEQTPNAYRAFRVLFDRCAAEPACAAAYPNLENVLYGLVEDWNAEPVFIAETQEALYGDDLLNLLFEYLYVTDIIPYLPRLIYELDGGDFSTYVALQEGSLPLTNEGSFADEGSEGEWWVEEFYGVFDLLEEDNAINAFYEIEPGDFVALEDWMYEYFSEEDADYFVGWLEEMDEQPYRDAMFLLYAEDVSDTQGLFDAIECNEEIPFNNLATAESLAQAVPEPLRGAMLIDVEGQFETCANWQSGVAPAIEDMPVASDIPTLVLAGEFDPITPPVWGQIAAATLSRSFYVEFPGVGHGAIDGGTCPMQIIQTFLVTPLTPPDTTCIAAMKVNFVSP